MAGTQPPDPELAFKEGHTIAFGNFGSISRSRSTLPNQTVCQRRQTLRHIGHLARDGHGLIGAGQRGDGAASHGLAGQALQGRQIKAGDAVQIARALVIARALGIAWALGIVVLGIVVLGICHVMNVGQHPIAIRVRIRRCGPMQCRAMHC